MYVAGVDIGGTNLKFGVFDENGQPVYTLLRRTARGGPEAIASQIAADFRVFFITTTFLSDFFSNLIYAHKVSLLLCFHYLT